MGYAEVIEQQLATLAYIRTPACRREIAGIIDEFAASDPVDELGRILKREAADSDPDAIVREVCDDLGQAAPYYVAADITPLIERGAASWPREVRPDLSALPTLAGFVLFDRPLMADVVPEASMALRALSWCCHIAAPHADPLDIATIVGYSRPVDGGGLFPAVFDHVPLSMARPLPPGAGHLRHYLGALGAFLSQTILTVSSRPIGNRQARKRYARQFAHDPLVRVVELRRREYQQRDESQARPVEYSCQWVVRGHWHQYHTKDGLQPRWVMPYVKGPSDKPFKAPQQIAYEVVR